MDIRQKTLILLMKNDEEKLKSVLGRFIPSRDLMQKRFVMFVQGERSIVLPCNIEHFRGNLLQAVSSELLRRKELGCPRVAVSCFEGRHLNLGIPDASNLRHLF